MKLDKAIFSTLAYSDHFNFPLSIEEMYVRLVGARSSRPQTMLRIQQLVKSKVISQSGEYFHLPNRSHLVALRQQNQITSNKLLIRARSLSSNISRLSSNILAIYLTGSLAVGNAGGDADIDLMIITKNNRLWTTRLTITSYATLYGLRRTPRSTTNSGKLCLNLYLTPRAFLLPSDRRSLYTAYELIQTKPLYDPFDTYSQLLSTNSWITQYLPNFPLPKKDHQPLYDFKSLRLYDNLLEKVLYYLQLLYMRRKITREYITPHAAFFHPNNPAPKV